MILLEINVFVYFVFFVTILLKSMLTVKEKKWYR